MSETKKNSASLYIDIYYYFGNILRKYVSYNRVFKLLNYIILKKVTF